jgi:zinc/manganese transport system substrate-binding protein
VQVVVSVNQWGDIVETLGGQCVEVTTIINGGDVDPHDFEPTPADTVAFEQADLVVVNGLDYDHWAEDAVAGLSPEPAVVNAGEVVGLEEGVNPHIWYGPQYVEQVAAAVETELATLLPAAGAYLADQSAEWQADLKAYQDEIAATRAVVTGKPYGATESVFEYMADALGMVDATPEGYQRAAANETDPSPADIAAFETALKGGAMTVLIYNTQTEGAVPEQLRGVAEGANVPVVEVTESVPPGAESFVEWQILQLTALADALGG